MSNPTRFGICTDFENISGVAQAGFDFIEPKMYDIALASDGEFAAMQVAVLRSGIACEAVNFFYPPNFRVVGNDIALVEIHNYIKLALGRAVLLGVRNITVGSGPARRVPDGFSRDEAFCQFGDQVRYAGQIAAEHNITVTIEPIRPASTNLVNTIAEGAALAEYVNLPNVKTMVDLNQMLGAGDTVEMIYNYPDCIGHLHTVDVENTSYPTDPGDPLQRAFVKAYLSVNPSGRITIEGAPFTTVETAKECLNALKAYVAQSREMA